MFSKEKHLFLSVLFHLKNLLSELICRSAYCSTLRSMKFLKKNLFKVSATS